MALSSLYASIGYDGSRFYGFQSQPHNHTVQDYLKEKLSDFFQEEICIRGVSRTDSGVHAWDQRIEWQSKTRIPVNKIPQVINSKLDGVKLNWVVELPQFIESAVSLSHRKQYDYLVRFQNFQPFHESYSWCLKESIGDLSNFQSIVSLFSGEHDFSNFCKIDKTRNITDFRRKILWSRFLNIDEGICISIKGDGFLWKMIRYIVCASIRCQKGSLTPEYISTLLQGRSHTGENFQLSPAPACGLYLKSCEIVCESEPDSELVEWVNYVNREYGKRES